MNEQEKTVELLKYILKSKKLDDVIQRLDFGINLFGKPISEDKHIFLRIVKPKDKLVISAREEFIPKKDKNGYWINFPTNNSKLQFITPNVECVPANITIEDVISIIQKKVCFQIDHANRFPEEYEGNLSENEFEELIEEIKTYANDINRAY